MPTLDTIRAPPSRCLCLVVGIIGESACWRLCRARHKRHTFASRLVMTGADLRTVADLLGHANIQMTMRYAHLGPAHKQIAVDRLKAFSGGPKSGIVGR
jgi:hypothetical protein